MSAADDTIAFPAFESGQDVADVMAVDYDDPQFADFNVAQLPFGAETPISLDSASEYMGNTMVNGSAWPGPAFVMQTMPPSLTTHFHYVSNIGDTESDILQPTGGIWNSSLSHLPLLTFDISNTSVRLGGSQNNAFGGGMPAAPEILNTLPDMNALSTPSLMALDYSEIEIQDTQDSAPQTTLRQFAQSGGFITFSLNPNLDDSGRQRRSKTKTVRLNAP